MVYDSQKEFSFFHVCLHVNGKLVLSEWFRKGSGMEMANALGETTL